MHTRVHLSGFPEYESGCWMSFNYFIREEVASLTCQLFVNFCCQASTFLRTMLLLFFFSHSSFSFSALQDFVSLLSKQLTYMASRILLQSLSNSQVQVKKKTQPRLEGTSDQHYGRSLKSYDKLKINKDGNISKGDCGLGVDIDICHLKFQTKGYEIFTQNVTFQSFPMIIRRDAPRSLDQLYLPSFCHSSPDSTSQFFPIQQLRLF